jgi:hypothetical protein
MPKPTPKANPVKKVFIARLEISVKEKIDVLHSEVVVRKQSSFHETSLASAGASSTLRLRLASHLTNPKIKESFDAKPDTKPFGKHNGQRSGPFP